MDTLNGSTTTSAIAISNIEEIFLIGKYKSALTLCNRYLLQNNEQQEHQKQQHERLNSSPTAATCHNSINEPLLLRTPLHLQCDIACQTRFVSIQQSFWHLSNQSVGAKEDENEDRSMNVQKVGAMALQSWYELSKQQQQLHLEKTSAMTRYQDDDDMEGYRFLQPYLDAFTTLSATSSSSSQNKYMSVELFVIFIRFLSSSMVGQDVAAMSLVVEFLRQLRSSPFIASPDDERSQNHFSVAERTCCEEIIVHFFTELLPQKCSSINYGNQLLDFIKDSNTNISIESLPSIISAMLNESKIHQGSRKEMIQLCLQYCNTDDGKWPKCEWMDIAFCQCRKLLQRQLNLMYYDKQSCLRDKERNNTTGSAHNEIVNIHTSEEQPTKRTNRYTSKLMVQLWQICQTFRCRLLQKLPSLKLHAMTKRNEDTAGSTPHSLAHNNLQRIDDLRILSIMATMVLLSLYRYRHTISKVLRTAITMALWQPIQEIIQAIRNNP